MTILKTENLSHKYGANWAIKDINLDLSNTGIVGLLGSNGAGKSTIMNIICGTLNQTKGDVLIMGHDLRKEPEKAKRQIGFLPQNLPLYHDFTVDEYLTYAAHLRFMEKSAIPRAVEEVKEKCQIAHFSNRLIKNLSGGYRQRVGIAQAIIHKPKIVVMDEPTTGLDPNQLIEARKLIREIGKEQTVLLSSHILSEISMLCRDIIMIESGRIVFSDSMDAFNNYAEKQTLTVRFDHPPALEDLLAIDGITHVESINATEFRVHFSSPKGLSQNIIEMSTANGWGLQELHYEKQVLDDIFKQLSTGTSQ